MSNGIAILERLFVLEGIKNKTMAEWEEYRLLKSMEEKSEPIEYEEDEDYEDDCYDEAERVGMTQTVYGWM